MSCCCSIQTEFTERDYCIITLFLNCGMRLSELVGINLTDFKEETIRIVGKGNKERTVYLTEACKAAIGPYLAARAALTNLKDRNAMFVSKRTGKRLTARRVEQIVAECPGPGGPGRQGLFPPQAAPHRRDPDVPQRAGGYAGFTGNTGPCQCLHHPDLHPYLPLAAG